MLWWRTSIPVPDHGICPQYDSVEICRAERNLRWLEPSRGRVMENFIATITYLLIGMGLRHIPRFHRETGTVLNVFVIYISLPAMVLLKIPQLAFSGKELLILSLMPWGMLVFSWAVIVALARFFQWGRSTTGCLLLLVPLGNTSFLGIPMVKAFFGDHAVPYAVLYDQLGSFLALATYGSLILAYYGAGDVAPTPRDVLKKIMTFPPFLALLSALLLRGVTCPVIAASVLNSLAATLVPMVMIAVGFQLTLRLSRALIGQLGIGLAVKLVVAPLAAFLFCKIMDMQGEVVQVAIFEAGMPPMVSAGALAIMADFSPPLTSALVGAGIILSFVSLPMLYQLLS